MCTGQFPNDDGREQLLYSIEDHRFIALIKQCISHDKDKRPTALEHIILYRRAVSSVDLFNCGVHQTHVPPLVKTTSYTSTTAAYVATVVCGLCITVCTHWCYSVHE